MVKKRISLRGILSSLHRILSATQIFALLIISASLYSCYNEPEFVGKNLLPTGDLKSIKIDTTFEVSAYTVKTDSIPAGFFNSGVLGCYNSEIFGKTRSEFVTQVFMINQKDTILTKMSTRPAADSLVLYLPLTKTFGTNNKSINVKVYELLDTLNYYFYYNGLRGSLGVRYNPIPVNLPTVYSGEDTLKIKFNDSFAQKLINAPDSILASNNKFEKYFLNGLYFTSDDYNGNDGVLYFFRNSGFFLRLYYKAQDKWHGVFNTTFNFSSGSGRFNRFSHDYLSANPAMKINHLNDTTFQDSVFYISGLGGARGLIKLDGVKEWTKKMPVAINRAELRIDVQEHPSINKDSIINPILYYYNRDNDTSRVKSYKSTTTNDLITLYDYVLTGVQTSKYFKPKKYYSIDITFHLQNLLKGKVKNNYFYIESSDFKTNYKEGVFRTGKNSNRIKLIITYSKL